MKKWVVIINFIIIMSLVSCGKKETPDRILEDMSKNMKEVKSISGNVFWKMKIPFDKELPIGEWQSEYKVLEVEMEMVYAVLADESSSFLQGTSEVMASDRWNAAGTANYKSGYFNEEEEPILYYSSEDMEEWWKRPMKNKTPISLSTIIDMKEIYENYTLSSKTTKVNKKKCFLLEGEIEAAQLAKLLAGSMEWYEMGTEVSFEKIIREYKGKIPVKLEIYKETFLPAKIRINLAPIFNGKKQEIVVTIMQYDEKMKNMLPKSVRENAMWEKEEEAEGGFSFRMQE